MQIPSGRPLLPAVMCMVVLLSFSLDFSASGQTSRKEDYVKKRAVNKLNSATRTAGNGMYEIVIEDFIGAGVGLYSVRTGPDHPLTEAFMNRPQDLLFGANNDEAGTSYTTIRSYSSRTDYVQSEFAVSDSGFQKIWLDNIFISEDSVVSHTNFIKPITDGTRTTGYRVIYSLPDALEDVPDSLQIEQVTNVHGAEFESSWVEITTIVRNLGTQSVEVGIRYLWDLIIAGDDGANVLLFPSEIAIGKNEASLTELDSFFVAAANDFIDAAPPAYNTFGSAMTADRFGLVDVKLPERLQQVSWPLAFFKSFEYQVHDSLDVTTKNDPNAGATGGDNAIQYFWGADVPLTIEPDNSIQVTQALVASLPGVVPPIIRPAGRVLYGVDGDDDFLTRLDVDEKTPSVEVLGKVVDGSKPIVDMEAMTWDPVSGRIIVVSNEGNGPLYMIDPADINGTADIPATLIGPTDSDDIEGIAVNPVTGELFGVDNTSHKLVKINKSTGTATEVGDLGFKDVEGLAFTLESNPVLFGADTKTGKLITIDTETGAGSSVDSVNLIGFQDVESLEFDRDGELFGFSNGDTHQFITIDRQTGIGEVLPVLGSDSLDIEGLTFMLPQALLSSTITALTDDKRSSLPDDFALEQNYPNPFNPTTSIRFQIPDNGTRVGQAKLQIYNLLGQFVRALVNEPKLPGEYRVEWDGKDQNGELVASGLYLYILSANDSRLIRKMMLIR